MQHRTEARQETVGGTGRGRERGGAEAAVQHAQTGVGAELTEVEAGPVRGRRRWSMRRRPCGGGKTCRWRMVVAAQTQGRWVTSRAGELRLTSAVLEEVVGHWTRPEASYRQWGPLLGGSGGRGNNVDALGCFLARLDSRMKAPLSGDAGRTRAAANGARGAMAWLA
jgi:hypothetical protein